MNPVQNLLNRLRSDHGVDLDEEAVREMMETDSTLILSTELEGTAGGRLEVFFADSAEFSEKDGVMWAPMIRSGQWALRPGPNGKKLKVPLKIIAGTSKDPRKEIGLQDLLDAFKDDAIEYVTVPQTHSNNTLENTGFIRDMRIVDGKDKSGNAVKVLEGAYDFTEPDVKGKVTRGTVAGRSCGILYDYEHTETGKKYPAVIEHVALTNRPWITGMTPFGRKLAASQDVSIESLSLSDDPLPPEDLELADGEGTAVWSHDESTTWIREQANQALRAIRDAHRQSQREQTGSVDYSDSFPMWTVRDVAAGKILVSDDYGDGANYWVVPYAVENGEFTLSQMTTWTKVKSIYVADERQGEAGDEGDDTAPNGSPTGLSGSVTDPKIESPAPQTSADLLRLAQARRRARSAPENDNNDHPRGGDGMEGSGKKDDTQLELSDAAKAEIAKRDEKLAAQEARIAELTGTTERLSSTVQKNEVDAYLDSLSDDFKDHPGVLKVVRDAMLEDDLGPAIVSEKFSEDGNTEVSLSVTDILKRVFDAFAREDDGRLKLSSSVTPPSSDAEDGDKPGKGDEETEMTPEQKADAVLSASPEFAEALAIDAPTAEPVPAGVGAGEGGGD